MPEAPQVNRAELTRALEALGFSLEAGAVAGLALYLEKFCQWNAAMNLSAFTNWRDVLAHLVADSFHLARFLRQLPLPAEPLAWDLGAGGGLPGIPLRLVWRRGLYWLVERRAKRALFLSTVLAHLPLPGTRVFRGEARSFFQEQGAGAQLVISRAFRPWQKLLPLLRDKLRADGLAILFATQPPPPALPAPWSALAERAYPAPNGAQRWFWALRPLREARS